MATFLYAYVSTAEETIAHQRGEVLAAGYSFDRVICDYVDLGAQTTLHQRRQGRRLFDLLQWGDELLVRCLARLGRDEAEVTRTMLEFLKMGVTIRSVIDGASYRGGELTGMTIREAMTACGAMAQKQSDSRRLAQGTNLGLASNERKSRKPTCDRATFDIINTLLGRGIALTAVADAAKVDTLTVRRIRNNPARQVSLYGS
ncbi:recombinase family protein [Devosia sp.]|uniref:recombinase family protein n=1 Tax=Devosia sp. TaxID=1871048 RepID=UPI00326647C9